MRQRTHLNDPKAAPHTLQSQLAAHFDEIAPLHDGKWQAVAFGRRLSEAHWKAEQDRRSRSAVQGGDFDDFDRSP
jgi:hypothetical protein